MSPLSAPYRQDAVIATDSCLNLSETTFLGFFLVSKTASTNTNKHNGAIGAGTGVQNGLTDTRRRLRVRHSAET